MSDNILIGMTGLARSGKDTVADYLVKEYGFVKMSLAGPLKEMARRIDPIIGYDLEAIEYKGNFGEAVRRDLTDVTPVRLVDALDRLGEDEVKARFPEYRNFLVKLGTDGIRHVDDSFWIDLAMSGIEDELMGGSGRVVVTDVRFQNEADAIITQGWGGFTSSRLWNVDRPGLTRDGSSTEALAGKLGEDVVIHNDGTLLKLGKQVDKLINITIEEGPIVPF